MTSLRTQRPRRSALYMPGSNDRALAKARDIPADVVIFDLEDAVAPEAKASARRSIGAALEQGGYERREVVVRLNSADTAWWQEDIDFVNRQTGIDGIMLPKVAEPDTVRRVAAGLNAEPGTKPTLWPMIETPAGVAAVRSIACADPGVSCLVLGTQDLAKAMRIPAEPSRLGLLAALSECILSARLFGLDVLDGVYANFRDDTGLRADCLQGRALGFDGKTLIHPNQVDIANEVFGPGSEEVVAARRIIEAWEQRTPGSGVIQLDGQMIELLHVEEARALVAFADAIAAKG